MELPDSRVEGYVTEQWRNLINGAIKSMKAQHKPDFVVLSRNSEEVDSILTTKAATGSQDGAHTYDHLF